MIPEPLLLQILIIAAVVDLVIALANGETGIGAFLEPGVIVLILVANATVGVVTETNAEAAIEELKAYEADVATVLRDGRWIVLPAAELVPGDVVEVAVGNKVPADLRLVELLSSGLRVDQSILTGESGSVGKDVEPVNIPKAVYQDKTNTLFSGTVVTAGRGRGVVVGTGSLTAIGRIRDAMVDACEQDTPLKQKLDQFGAFLSKVIAVICLLVWVVNLPHFSDPLHGSWFGGALYYFKIAVALAVAAIPEGLPAVVTTCLALGTRQMAKRNAIVRSLPSVETLGCTTVICSDKTGTLTTNQMSVVRFCGFAAAPSNNNNNNKNSKNKNKNNMVAVVMEYEISGTSYSPEGQVTVAATGMQVPIPADIPTLLQTSACAALCNDSHLHYHPEANRAEIGYQRVGEATEIALRIFAEKIGLPGYSAMPSALARLPMSERATFCNDQWEKQYRKVFTLEFGRERKRMSVLCADEATGDLVLFCKGAPEAILDNCTTILLEDGTVVPLDEEYKQMVASKVAEWGSSSALRVLAFASRPWGQRSNSNSKSNSNSSSKLKSKEVSPEDESDMCFLGLVGMQDPPRAEVSAAIQQCKAAGIRVIIVTGDNKATAESVGRQIGLFKEGDLNTTGSLNSSSQNIELMEVVLEEGGLNSGVLPPYSTRNRQEGEGQESLPTFSRQFEKSRSLAGTEFEELGPGPKAAAAARLILLSRVEPTHKSQLVELLQDQGHVVAMTGDGVNDAPALKRADIGVAMGSGTAVAKHAADMVLADDNFATIVAAVAAGRAIFSNTRQFIRYMVSSNIGEVVAIFSAALLGIPECLNPVQLLWVNLVTDGLPATAIGFNKPDADIMRRPPRRRTDGVVDAWLLVRYLVVGLYVGGATAYGFVWWYVSFQGGPQLTWSQLRNFQKCSRDVGMAVENAQNLGNSTLLHDSRSLIPNMDSVSCDVFRSHGASTVSMSVLVIVEMFNALNALSENGSLLQLPPWSNPWLLGAITLSVILHLSILYTPPLAAMFSVTPLSWAEWKMVLWLSAPIILVDELLKAVSRVSRVGRGKPNGGGGPTSTGTATGSLDGSATIRWVCCKIVQPFVYVKNALGAVLRGGGKDSLFAYRKLSGEGLPTVSPITTLTRRQP